MPNLKYRDPKTGKFVKLPFITAGGEIAGNYLHIQDNASNIWNIEHNLNKFPSVTIMNTSNEQIFGEILYLNENNVQIKFSAAVSGKATLN